MNNVKEHLAISAGLQHVGYRGMLLFYNFKLNLMVIFVGHFGWEFVRAVDCRKL